MASKSKNPASAVQGASTGFGVVSCSAASDHLEIANRLAFVQADYIARRTRLRPDLASVVAELCFDRRLA